MRYIKAILKRITIVGGVSSAGLFAQVVLPICNVGQAITVVLGDSRSCVITYTFTRGDETRGGYRCISTTR